MPATACAADTQCSVALTLRPSGASPPRRRRVVGAAQLDDRAGVVLDDVGAGHQVGVAEAHFPARGQAEELLRRLLHEVVALDVDLPRERHLARARGGILRVVDDVHVLDELVGIVRQDQLQRAEHRHRPRRMPVEILAHAVLEQPDVDHVLLLGDADPRAEVANRLGRVAAPPQAGDGRHPRIVPARDVTLRHQLEQLSLAHHGVAQVEPRELVLPGLVLGPDLFDAPVVERPVIDVLERAQRMGHALDRVRQRVGVVVHRVDAPRIAGPVMVGVPDAVQHRVAHRDVGRRHVDLRPQDVRAIRELAGPHPAEEIQVLLDAAIAIGRVRCRAE